jgi:hypothetical protein
MLGNGPLETRKVAEMLDRHGPILHHPSHPS